MATRLAADGMTVVVHYAGNPAPAQEVAKEIIDGGGSAVTAQADVAVNPLIGGYSRIEKPEVGCRTAESTGGGRRGACPASMRSSRGKG